MRWEGRINDKVPSERILRRIVNLCKVPKKRKPEYISFARELALVIRKPPVPDFSRRAKGIVLKYFNRGLSGQLLWRVGCAVIGWRFPDKKGEKYGKKP